MSNTKSLKIKTASYLAFVKDVANSLGVKVAQEATYESSVWEKRFNELVTPTATAVFSAALKQLQSGEEEPGSGIDINYQLRGLIDVGTKGWNDKQTDTRELEYTGTKLKSEVLKAQIDKAIANAIVKITAEMAAKKVSSKVFYINFFFKKETHIKPQ
jgi:hypothetical protein